MGVAASTPDIGLPPRLPPAEVDDGSDPFSSVIGVGRKGSSWRRLFEGAEIAIGHPISPEILSILDDAYGHRVSELGYETEGHLCLTEDDLAVAKTSHSSLLYGEVLPHGVVKMLDEEHLRAEQARRLFDLGSGTGKLCMQGA